MSFCPAIVAMTGAGVDGSNSEEDAPSMPATVRAYSMTMYDDDLPTALWHGIFHAISAFNNAGFALYSDNLIGFVGDGWIIAPICLAIIAGGIGYPSYFELVRRWNRPRLWGISLRLTLA